jgi:TatA/E family protein of Tat protein translocase
VNIGPMEIVIVLILALLVFGPKRLPQAGRSLGQALRELKKATSSARSELGLDDVAADVRDLKSSLTIDLKATDAPTPPRPVDRTAAVAATTAAVVDVLPAAAAMPEAEAAAAETPEALETADPDAAATDADVPGPAAGETDTEAAAPDTAAAPVGAEVAAPEPEAAPETHPEQSAL